MGVIDSLLIKRNNGFSVDRYYYMMKKWLLSKYKTCIKNYYVIKIQVLYFCIVLHLKNDQAQGERFAHGMVVDTEFSKPWIPYWSLSHSIYKKS